MATRLHASRVQTQERAWPRSTAALGWGGERLGTTQRLHYTLQPRLHPSDSHIVPINNEQFKSRKPPYLNITGNPILGSFRQLCGPSCPPAGGDPTRSLRLHTREPDPTQDTGQLARWASACPHMCTQDRPITNIWMSAEVAAGRAASSARSPGL